MNKTELIDWLRNEQQQWWDLLMQFDKAEMETPGLNGDWSLKDMVAHLTTWHRDHVLCLDAAVKGTTAADPPWPLELPNTDEVNAWIFSQSSQRGLSDVLDENENVFEALIGVVESFPLMTSRLKSWKDSRLSVLENNHSLWVISSITSMRTMSRKFGSG